MGLVSVFATYKLFGKKSAKVAFFAALWSVVLNLGIRMIPFDFASGVIVSTISTFLVVLLLSSGKLKIFKQFAVKEPMTLAITAAVIEAIYLQFFATVIIGFAGTAFLASVI